jgi:hypothetical protein
MAASGRMRASPRQQAFGVGIGHGHHVVGGLGGHVVFGKLAIARRDGFLRHAAIRAKPPGRVRESSS